MGRHEAVAMGRHEAVAMGRPTDLVLDASLPKHKNRNAKTETHVRTNERTDEVSP